VEQKLKRETRDFLMALIIKKSIKITTTKNTKKILGRDRDLSIYFGGTNIIIIFFYCLKKLFEKMEGGPWPQPVPPLPPSLRPTHKNYVLL
jgi:hypothetical protein